MRTKEHPEGLDITPFYPEIMKGLPFFIPGFLKRKMLDDMLQLLGM